MNLSFPVQLYIYKFPYQVDLPVISNDECMRWYDNSGSKQLIPESTFLCAG